MRVVNTRQSIISTIIESVGIKAGLLLTQDQLFDHLSRAYDAIGNTQKWWIGNPLQTLAIRAEDIEEDFLHVMQTIGAIQDNRNLYGVLHQFTKCAIERLGHEEGAIVVRSALEAVARGEIPSDVDGLPELIQAISQRSLTNTSKPVYRQWEESIRLVDLFEEEGELESQDGPYIDQRYIHYLNAQPEKLESINWRRFEYLTGEYFRRRGYEVKIGKGRKDGGKDVIASREDPDIGFEVICIQCKRHSGKETVAIDVVERLVTTTTDNSATKGLVATTTRLTADAKKYCDERRYKLSYADFDNVRKWLRAMAS